MSHEDYKLLADSSDPFICPACTAKKQGTIIQQLQSAIQSLNTEVQDLKAMVAALQSSSHGNLQCAAIGDTETGGGESHAKEAPPACKESELPWNVVAGRKNRKGKMSNERHTAKTTTLAKSGNVSPLTQRVPKQSKPKRVPATGARKIWGTVKHVTVAGVVGTLKVLGKVPSDAVLERENTKWQGTISNGLCAGGLLSEKNWNLISMQTLWKLEPLMAFESDSAPPQQNLDKICPDKSGEQSSAHRCLQYDKQTCNVPDNDAADNTILTNVDDSPHKPHSEHSPLCTVPPHVSKGANQ